MVLPRDCEVLVVGAGPAGLSLAAELERQGAVGVLLVDRQAEGSNLSRAAVIHARTLEVLEPLGATAELLRAGHAVQVFRMREQDRLRSLQVGFSGHDRRRVCGGLCGQRRHHFQRRIADPAHGIAQPHPEQRGHLVISRPPGPQPATELGADPVDQPTLQRPVHVLVGDQRSEAAVGDVLAETVQPGQ